MITPNKTRILFTTDTEFAINQASDGKPITLTGYAMKWNTLSSDRGGYVVRLAPYSATPADPTFALVNHDYNNLLGRSDDKSLRLSFDDIGCNVEMDMPPTTIGKDSVWNVANGKIRGMSFAMIPDGAESIETVEDGQTIVTYTKFMFDEVTITPIPAFDDTSIAVKQDAPADTNNVAVLRLSKDLIEQHLKLQRLTIDHYRL